MRQKPMKLLLLLTAGVMASALAGCATELESYAPDMAGKVAPLDFKQFYTGKVNVAGTVHDWRGRVTRRFDEQLNARWDGPNGVMDDHMQFDDGETQSRVWHMQQLDATHYTFEATDIVGKGHATDMGGALLMRYTLAVPVGADKTVYNINFDDRSWLLPGGTQLMNKVTMRKFGFKVAELTAVITKAPPTMVGLR